MNVLKPGTASIEACPNGPLLLRGDFELLDADGGTVDPGRRTVALCRCGMSSIKPFCDGTHKATGFRTED
ncbi:MAG: CDGSH iron-sulfur domain-containing protein [Homoserinimonas sp.]